MKERPIIFSAPVVRTVLEGRKTQTRRVVKRQPNGTRGAMELTLSPPPCPYGEPGDRLWVKETWQDWCPLWNGHWCGCGDKKQKAARHRVVYRADDEEAQQINGSGPLRWRSPIFMPRWASRLTLEVTEVRVQTVQEISDEDALAEGVSWGPGVQESNIRKWGTQQTARMRFADLWDSINEKRGYSWESNPWVWAISFRLVGEHGRGE